MVVDKRYSLFKSFKKCWDWGGGENKGKFRVRMMYKMNVIWSYYSRIGRFIRFIDDIKLGSIDYRKD